MTNARQRYELYLQSDHWQALRKAALAQHGARCEFCNRTPKHPHVHHTRYRDLFSVTTEDLVILCQPCHEQVHKYLNRRRKGALKSRAKSFAWYTNTRTAKQVATATKKTTKPKPIKVRSKIRRLLKRQKTRGNQYGKTKLANLRGFFFPPPNKPPQRKNHFRSFSDGDYVQPREIGIQDQIANALANGNAVVIQNQGRPTTHSTQVSLN